MNIYILEKMIWVKTYCPWYIFLNTFLSIKKKAFDGNLYNFKILGRTIWIKPQCPRCSFFNKHLSTSFGGNSYKALERTIWVKPHCPANSFLINVWEHQEIYEVSWKFVLDPWKRHICQTALPLGQNLLKKIGKIQQQVICVFYNSWSNFSKRTVWVNPYCPWFIFLKRCLKQK